MAPDSKEFGAFFMMRKTATVAPRFMERSRGWSQVRIRTWVFPIGVLMAVSAPATPAQLPAPMPPPAAFGTPPRTSNVQLSFDGKSAAWLDLGAVPERIIVFDLANNKDRR